MGWLNSIDVDRSTNYRCGGGKRSRLNAVGHDAMCCAVQCVNTLNLNAIWLRARDLRTHGVEQRDEIVDFRLLCGWGDDRCALCQHRCKDCVFGAHYGDLREGDCCSLEASAALCKVVAVAIINLGAERAHGINVQVHGATADTVAAWIANDHAAEPGQEWAEEHEASAHLGGGFERHEEPFGIRRLQAHRFGGWSLNRDADVAEGVGEHINVKDPWNVLQIYPVAGKHRGGHHLKGGVLRTAHSHAASERLPALNAELLLGQGDRTVLPRERLHGGHGRILAVCSRSVQRGLTFLGHPHGRRRALALAAALSDAKVQEGSAQRGSGGCE